MMAAPPRTPPRFVPTLTDVVQLPGGVQPALPKMPQAGQAEPVASTPAPPQGVTPPSAPSPSGHGAATADALPHGFENYVVHRIMQRVDVVLEQRLREAIAQVVQELTRSMIPRLQEEVEAVVRHAVNEAVADELASYKNGH